MSAPERRAMVERLGKDLSVRRQCALSEFDAFGRLSARAGRRRRRSGHDAPDRRIASRTAVLRLAANSVRTQQGRPRRQPQARAKADARDGDRGAGSAPRHQQSRARPQDISLSAARREDCRDQSCLGGRHDLYPDGAWLSVSGGDYRLGQPGGSGVALVEHDGYGLLHRGARRSAGAARQAENIQHRSGRAVHRRLSPAGSRLQASRFRWTDAVASWTIFSSNGCGARSSTRKCI